MLKEIKRPPSLSAQAKALISNAIFSGDLPPGAHLVETRLAENFQISRGPLREALNALAADGLVEIHRGRGAFVVDPSPDEMQEMIVLRSMLNGMAARYATTRQDAAFLANLDSAVAQMRKAEARADEVAFFDAHWRYYETLFAPNAALHRAWSTLHGLIDLYIRRIGRPSLSLSLIRWNSERFVDLFRDGDADLAEAVVRGQTLIVGFAALQRDLPPDLWSYASHALDDKGDVRRFDPAEAFRRQSANNSPGRQRG